MFVGHLSVRAVVKTQIFPRGMAVLGGAYGCQSPRRRLPTASCQIAPGTPAGTKAPVLGGGVILLSLSRELPQKAEGDILPGRASPVPHVPQATGSYGAG